MSHDRIGRPEPDYEAPNEEIGEFDTEGVNQSICAMGTECKTGKCHHYHPNGQHPEAVSWPNGPPALDHWTCDYPECTLDVRHHHPDRHPIEGVIVEPIIERGDPLPVSVAFTPSEIISELAQLISGTDSAFDLGVASCIRVVSRLGK